MAIADGQIKNAAQSQQYDPLAQSYAKGIQPEPAAHIHHQFPAYQESVGKTGHQKTKQRQFFPFYVPGQIHAGCGKQGSAETIPAQELPLVFDRFHKIDKSRSQNRDSWGLGLYIVKTIIGFHGENISVTSRDGQTTFTFTLPIVN